ncbi:hypothetical protein DYU05_14300 [Mucilaginibacter terrenus]|uniref:Uncharacterized protein n=1 Tax=Mucilaginibacter terrenus TaxID=2482727 RepID=A0A3E2NQN2_9SPHI|nr:hypothetical protein [Mucilaginibacter terrenus]RFZ83302.1 hypothetical protein DYU05_14300 [Mucilaginibacter terrenus]
MAGQWTYIVIGVGVLLTIVLLWLEVKRANSARLVWRIIAVVVATLALACIALPLRYQGDAIKDTGKIILLTEGFDTDSLKAQSGAAVYTLDKNIKAAYNKAALLSGISQLTDTLHGAELHIYGNGLHQYDLDELGEVPVVFHQSGMIQGVISVNWPRHLKAGEPLLVQGRFRNSASGQVKLVLKGLNTVAASQFITNEGVSDFELSTIPKTTGRLVYTLQIVTNKDTLPAGELPFEVEPVKPLNVLMLSASPDFETRFLKNWLSEQGYGLAVRSVISKEKISSAYINMPQISLVRLTAGTLNKFDVVIGDLSSFNSLNDGESAALKQAIMDNGTGIVARFDSTAKVSWLQQRFPVEKTVNSQTASSLIIGANRSASTKLNTGGLHIRRIEDTQPLVTNSKAVLLAASTLTGAGKEVFTTLNNTYSWALAGEQKDYSTFWSALISNAAKKSNTAYPYIDQTAINYTNEPAELLLTKARVGSFKVDGVPVPLQQHMAIPFQWSARYWPAAAGWHQADIDGLKSWVYTYGARSWAGIAAAEHIRGTYRYVSEHTAANLVTKQIHQKVWMTVPKLYFYILLLAACTFLWIENKFS